MVRRVIFGSVAASALVAGLVVFNGCYTTHANLGDDCPFDFPIECCRCVWPEDCLDGKKGREVPASCDEPDGGGTMVDECSARARMQLRLPWWCWDVGVQFGADGGTADGGTSSRCSNGNCAVLPEGWEPVVLASGAMMVLPDCPSFAPNMLFEGTAVRGPDPTCPTCSCDVPVGACKPPTKWTIGSSACVGNDVWTNFDPPAGWDGSCTSNTAIAEGISCGGKPCVASINISAPVIEEEPCVAQAKVPPLDNIPRAKADGPYVNDGRACSAAWHSCATAGETCVPSVPEPFAACVMHEGDVLCPNGWDSKQVLYGAIDDQRFCSECSCLPSTGATCSMRVKVFSEATCSTSRLEVDVSVDMGQNCFPIMSGVALAGKSADVLEYKPGACEPTGGELIGDLVLADARTFCCRTSAS